MARHGTKLSGPSHRGLSQSLDCHGHTHWGWCRRFGLSALTEGYRVTQLRIA
jgi:hypothetical protein